MIVVSAMPSCSRVALTCLVKIVPLRKKELSVSTTKFVVREASVCSEKKALTFCLCASVPFHCTMFSSFDLFTLGGSSSINATGVLSCRLSRPCASGASVWPQCTRNLLIVMVLWVFQNLLINLWGNLRRNRCFFVMPV
jgi:hypothetical protein